VLAAFDQGDLRWLHHRRPAREARLTSRASIWHYATVPSNHVLDIKIINCGGLRDLMSEMESSFLVSALGLFRNVAGLGKGLPRANVNLVRAYDAKDFYRAAFDDVHILHLIGHAHADELEVGWSKTRVKAGDLYSKAYAAGHPLPPIVVATGCHVQSAKWQSGMTDAGAEILIASKDKPTPAALTAFDMAFYSALLAQVRRGKPLAERVKASFQLADAHYRAIHAVGTPFAKFTLVEL
jgi:hypothetical protein